MRRLLFAAALGVTLTQSAPAQQFGEDRKPATVPPHAQPAPAPAAPTKPAELPSFPAGPAAAPGAAARPAVAPESPHEWAVGPDSGAWMVCVKSYAGDTAKAHAVELAGVIRNQYRSTAYLFERNSEERRREEQRQANYRAAKEAELAPFLQAQAKFQAEAADKGIEFIETAATFRMPKVAIESQWAVLVGGFPDAETARKALDTVRTWPVPANVALLDRAVSSRPGEDGRAVLEGTYINPFRSAMVVPNPAAKRVAAAEANAPDPVLIKLNEEEPYSLLRNPKGWTLIVKDFTVPTTVQSKDQEGGIMARLFGDANDPSKLLDATANQARELAKALRTEAMGRGAQAAAGRAGLTPRPLESFVLHHRTGSRVTVGSFDAIDDPALVEMQQVLAHMYFEVWDKPQSQGGRLLEKKQMFDGITPMPVPRMAAPPK